MSHPVFWQNQSLRGVVAVILLLLFRVGPDEEHDGTGRLWVLGDGPQVANVEGLLWRWFRRVISEIVAEGGRFEEHPRRSEV